MTRRGRPTAFLALLVAIGLVSSGCSQLRAQATRAELGDAAVLEDRTPLLETVEWSDLDGLVSVVVRNDTDRVLARAEAVVTVRDAQGTVVPPVSPGVVPAGCCVDVPPGATYALQVEVPVDTEVSAVEVAFRDVSWSAAGGGTDGAQVQLLPVVLTANPLGAVIGARAQTLGAKIGSAVVQARLQDAEGRLVTVVSNTQTCLNPRIPRRVWMQSPRQVPVGTVIGSIVAFPGPAGSGPSPPCGPPVRH